jgi:hypothetical protein
VAATAPEGRLTMKGERAARYELTGLQRTYLETRRARIDPQLDGPAHDMAADLDPDGMVRFRPATVNEVLDRLISQWVWQSVVDDAVDGAMGEIT